MCRGLGSFLSCVRKLALVIILFLKLKNFLSLVCEKLFVPVVLDTIFSLIVKCTYFMKILGVRKFCLTMYQIILFFFYIFFASPNILV